MTYSNLMLGENVREPKSMKLLRLSRAVGITSFLWFAAATQAGEAVPCNEWNTATFFESAEATDIVRCLSTGVQDRLSGSPGTNATSPCGGIKHCAFGHSGAT